MMELKNYKPKTEEDLLIAIMTDSCVIVEPTESILDHAEEVKPFEVAVE